MSIIVVSDDKEFADLAASKLLFLRENDNICVCDYEKAPVYSADVALVCENASKNLTVDLIKKLRENKKRCIILLARSYDREFILSCYDAGIDDFSMCSAEDFELVIRIVNNMKHNSIKQKLIKNEQIMSKVQILDNDTAFYDYRFARLIFEDTFTGLNDLVFMALSPSNAFKSEFSIEKFSYAVRKILRASDSVCFGKDGNFYILLSNTDLNGAIVVLNKIKDNYENLELCAGILQVSSKSFDKVEKDSLEALSNALATNAEFVISEINDLDDWLENDGVKDYKIFRQIFNKKSTKIISPLFSEFEQAWKEKFSDIEYYIGDDKSVFSIKTPKYNSTLTLTYTGFAKIFISVDYEGLNSPENRRFELPLSKLTRQYLKELMEEFITGSELCYQ